MRKVRGFTILDVAFVGAAFAIVGAIFGAQAIGRHRYMQHQRELYQTYLAENAWREPTLSVYYQLAAQLDDLEKICPARENDTSRMDADMKEARRLANRLMTVANGPVYPGNVIRQQTQKLIASYQDGYERACSPWNLETDAEGRRWAVGWISAYPYNEGNEGPWLSPEVEKRMEGHVTHEESETLRKRLLTMRPWIGSNLVYAGSYQREEFEKILNSPPIVPAGLDLNLFKKPEPKHIIREHAPPANYH
jgi:hypothetical protein